MRVLLIIFIYWLTAYSSYGQRFNSKISLKVSNLPSITAKLDSFQSLGVKVDRSLALENTGEWLKNEISQLGLNSQFDSFITTGGSNQRNVRIELPGNSRTEFIVVGAHYDTRAGVGANDNGSGVACLLTCLELLRNEKLKYPIQFIFFSGEEQGFFGSKFYVDSILSRERRTLKFMYNIDQIGGTAGSNQNDRIYCERDESVVPNSNNSKSASITDTIANMANLYTSITPVVSAAYSSDYIPFEAEGEVITGLYQFADYPFTHSISDSIQYMDTNYLKEGIRITLASLLHFSAAEGYVTAETSDIPKVKVYPNPAVTSLTIESSQKYNSYSIINALGENIVRGTMNSPTIDISALSKGVYFLKLSSEKYSSIHNFAKL